MRFTARCQTGSSSGHNYQLLFVGDVSTHSQVEDKNVKHSNLFLSPQESEVREMSNGVESTTFLQIEEAVQACGRF